MQNQKLKLTKISKSISYAKQMNNREQQEQEYENKKMNSSLLPKIHKTTVITQSKSKNNQNSLNYSTKVVVCEIEEIQKRKKMAHIIGDYLENFRLKQKSSLLAVTSHKNKIQHKPIQVEGISHTKFIGREHTSLDDINNSSSKKLYRLRANKSFIQKIRKDCKIDSKPREKKMQTEPNKEYNENSSLKGYILKAKKSVIDCKQKSKQKVNGYKKVSQLQPW